VTHDPYAALRIRNYRWFIVSLMTMTISSQIQGVVVAWQIYDITHDPLSLGLMGLAEALPFVTAALYAGHVADRFDRHKIAITAITALLGCSLTLLSFNLVPGFLTTHGAVPFYAVIFVSGFARSFLQPARNALGAELVDRSLYANAVAWRSSTWQTAAVVGPAIGGLIYGYLSPRFAYVADAIMMVTSLAAFWWIDYERRAASEKRESIGESLRRAREMLAQLGRHRIPQIGRLVDMVVGRDDEGRHLRCRLLHAGVDIAGRHIVEGQIGHAILLRILARPGSRLRVGEAGQRSLCPLMSVAKDI